MATSANCGLPAAGGEQGAQLRYETLVGFIARLNQASTLEEAARSVVGDLKYVLRFDGFRLLLADGAGGMALFGTLREVHVAALGPGSLTPVEERALGARVPYFLTESDLASTTPPPPLGGGFGEVYVYPAPARDGSPDHAFFIAVRGGSLDALDLKFAVLVARLLAGKLRQICAEQRTREAEAARHQAGLRLAEAYRVLATRDERLRKDLEQARAFQQRLLPTLPSSTSLRFCAAYAPAELVGGDIYDVCELAPGRFRVFLADASGHGVQASLRTMVLKTEYDRLKRSYADAGELLAALDERLTEGFGDLEMRCTACCVDVDTNREGGASLRYANAGHVPLLIVGPGGAREVYEPGAFLGVLPTARPAASDGWLAHGERLLVYSDGLTEQAGSDGEEFGVARAASTLAAGITIESAAANLLSELARFAGPAGLQDDTTLIAVECGRRAP
jgi:serine phosphatase RsbU (regulator of sigma subunit)